MEVLLDYVHLLKILITTWRLYGSTLRLCSFIENVDSQFIAPPVAHSHNERLTFCIA